MSTLRPLFSLLLPVSKIQPRNCMEYLVNKLACEGCTVSTACETLSSAGQFKEHLLGTSDRFLACEQSFYSMSLYLMGL
jgi:hypothetical protein